MRVAPGETLAGGRYRLERVLGTGGMASVWLARDRQLDRPVAIKVIADTLALDEAYVTRFGREARIAAGLSHPNLVKVFDFAADGERPYLVMEYVSGTTLAHRGEAGYADAGGLARALLGALAHIHEASVVHRDVKPANVLLGDDGRPRLTDFGIAHTADATHLTNTGQVIGTARYMAPEVARGEPATPASDLYALGVVLAEVAAPEARRSLGRLVGHLMAADPAARPASATAALALLPDDDQPPPPPPPPPLPPPPPASASASRRRLTVFAALAALIAVVIVADSGGGAHPAGASSRAPVPAGASLSRQLDGLERAVRAAPGR